MTTEELKTIPLFAELMPDELEALSTLVRLRSVRDGVKIVREGGQIDALYFVCEGVVHVRRMARTREMLLGRIEKGGFFGEVNLFGIGKATASVIAMKKAVVACISYMDMKAFFALHPAAAFKITSYILSEVCNRLYRADNRFLAAVFWTNVNP